MTDHFEKQVNILNVILFRLYTFYGTGLFYTPCKHQKTSGLMVFSGDVGNDYLFEMG